MADKAYDQGKKGGKVTEGQRRVPEHYPRFGGPEENLLQDLSLSGIEVEKRKDLSDVDPREERI